MDIKSGPMCEESFVECSFDITANQLREENESNGIMTEMASNLFKGAMHDPDLLNKADYSNILC